jgi:transglutaminase-like putative cysteine protease
VVVVVVVVLSAVIATVVNKPKTPVPVDQQVPNPAPVVPSSVAPATTAPVPPPTPPPARVNSVVPYINSITLSNQTLSYPPSSTGSTAEERAVQWLIEDDLTTATDDLKALSQRYVLSTL